MKTLLAATASLALIAAPAFAADYNSADAQAEATVKADIVDTAKAAGQFGTLLAAAEAAGLVGALKGEGPLTVFAPTDEAFAALPEGTVETLLKPENKDQLAGILQYHVIAGAKVKSGDLAGKTTTAATLNGDVAIDGTDGVTVNGANVIAADVKASNGVIHVIDTVLIPGA